MIIEYHRPQTLSDALALLEREFPLTVALAGGTSLDRNTETPIAVVDLQALGLNSIDLRGNQTEIGATTTLQELRGAPLPQALLKAIDLEATYNLRQMATIGGTIVAADGRSGFTTVLLALDANVEMLPDKVSTGVGELLPLRRERLRGKLITKIRIPTNVRLAYEAIARTPADLPIVCAALASWPSGRSRLALGGFGTAPTLAFDGNDTAGLAAAARSAYFQAEDEWASSEYRREMAGILADRCLQELTEKAAD